MTLRFPPPCPDSLCCLRLSWWAAAAPRKPNTWRPHARWSRSATSRRPGIQLKSAIQLNPKGAEARFLHGKVLLETGDSAAAAVELRKAAELGYDENQLIPPLASAMVQQGEAKQVVEQFASKNLTGLKKGQPEDFIGLGLFQAG
jgi:hypothetical protein